MFAHKMGDILNCINKQTPKAQINMDGLGIFRF